MDRNARSRQHKQRKAIGRRARSNRSADIDYAQAEVELASAIAQLAAIRKLRGK